jgi:hypothetical protein
MRRAMLQFYHDPTLFRIMLQSILPQVKFMTGSTCFANQLKQSERLCIQTLRRFHMNMPWYRRGCE